MDPKTDSRTHLQRLGTNLTSALPSRVQTDPPSPEKQRAHLHRRLHASSITGRNALTTHGRRAKDTVQSAIDLRPPVSFEHLLRRGDKRSADSSRRESFGHQGQQRGVEEWRAAQHAQKLEEARRRPVGPQDVVKARSENERRDEELRRRLKSVEDVGMTSTRQLDDTYYAILEKASMLRSTVASLQQLAEESRRMHTGFQDDAQALERNTRTEMESFEGFKQQEKSVDELVARLQASKAETEKLNMRLETTRRRVGAYEHRENARQAKRMKQWHATWGTLLGVLVLVLAIVALRHYQSISVHLDGMGRSIRHSGGHAGSTAKLKAKPTLSEDPFLKKLFDEL